jgi:hypothetical protein
MVHGCVCVCGGKRELAIDDFRAAQWQPAMTRGSRNSERLGSASLWRSRLCLSRGLLYHHLRPITTRNHASSTARVEEGQHRRASPLALHLTSIQYLDRRLFVQLNGSRKVIGVLRGYDVRVLSLSPAAPVY